MAFSTFDADLAPGGCNGRVVSLLSVFCIEFDDALPVFTV